MKYDLEGERIEIKGDIFARYEFEINGAKVRAVFPRATDVNTMGMVKNILVKSYKHSANKQEGNIACNPNV